MCNIAGYVGTRAAAPILLEMLKREEGFDGGFYTGIATLHEGKIYYAKLTGDVDRLTALTEAAKLPGTIGIAHSRTKSGGGDEWAHPFIGGRPGEARLAYVANGSVGSFADRKPTFDLLSNELLDEGYRLDSRIRIESDKYQALRDGTKVHMSDVMAQLIARNLEGGESGAKAMEQGFCAMPSEIVGLMIEPQAADRISYARINMPMMVSHAEHGTYLATTVFAIPEDGAEAVLLPLCSAGWVGAGTVVSAPMQAPPAAAEPITPQIKAMARERMIAAMEESPKTFSELRMITKACFCSPCCEFPPLGYQILWEMKDQLCFEMRRVEGAFAPLDAPKFYISLK
ncbi:MAG: hypothetical protein IJN82_05750 [Clostridia bacterium]|nr:hypothetical protein [Clostridia bacterium]